MNATCVGVCSDIEAPVLATAWFLSYGLFITVIAVCGNFLNNRLHDLVTETVLERKRQGDLFERFLLHYEGEFEEEEEE